MYPSAVPEAFPVVATETEDGFLLESSTLRLRTDGSGLPLALTVRTSGLESLPAPLALLPGETRAALVPNDDEGESLVVRSREGGVRWQARLDLDPARPIVHLDLRMAGPVAAHRVVLAPPDFPHATDPSGDRLVGTLDLGPLGTDHRRLRLRPTPGFGSGRRWTGESGTAEWSDGVLRLTVDDPSPAARIGLVDAGGPREARVDLYPERPVALALPVAPDGLSVNGVPWTAESRVKPPVLSSPTWTPPTGLAELREHVHLVPVRAAALFRLAARTPDDAEAADLVETALLYCGDHPLLWAARAIFARRLGEEHPALANLHYLWPLEPVLRTEAFLGGEVGGTEGSPLLAPLTDAEALEAAEIYADLGRDDDFYRVADDLLRSRDLPALRYLAAARELARGYDAEAAGSVAKGEAAAGDGPPPGDPVALRALAARFPTAERLARFADPGTYA